MMSMYFEMENEARNLCAKRWTISKWFFLKWFFSLSHRSRLHSFLIAISQVVRDPPPRFFFIPLSLSSLYFSVIDIEIAPALLNVYWTDFITLSQYVANVLLYTLPSLAIGLPPSLLPSSSPLMARILGYICCKRWRKKIYITRWFQAIVYYFNGTLF